ncbi:MAG: LPS export ABC transporter periplasmic protein LptC [Panacagrimonas sp.]
MPRYAGPVIVVVVLALAMLVLRKEERVAPAVAAQADPPRYTVRGAQWSRYGETGKVEFQGRAESIDYFDDESARLAKVEVTAPNTSGGAPWIASAPEGRMPAKVHRVLLSGGVDGKGQWPDGEALKFSTPELWLDSDRNELSTRAAIQLDSRSKQAQAQGLVVDGKRRTVALLGDVKMRYTRAH